MAIHRRLLRLNRLASGCGDASSSRHWPPKSPGGGKPPVSLLSEPQKAHARLLSALFEGFPSSKLSQDQVVSILMYSSSPGQLPPSLAATLRGFDKGAILGEIWPSTCAFESADPGSIHDHIGIE